METLPLEWFQSHPYVQTWRAQDNNSFFPTVKTLNSVLNINIDYPITLSRVDNIVTHYLTLLVRHIRSVCTAEKLPRSRDLIAKRFGLNKTETNYVINKFQKDE